MSEMTWDAPKLAQNYGNAINYRKQKTKVALNSQKRLIYAFNRLIRFLLTK